VSAFFAHWRKHFAQNIGSAIAATYYAVLPPQWTGHTAADLEYLNKHTAWRLFLRGITS
jgi:hypothetical protein